MCNPKTARHKQAAPLVFTRDSWGGFQAGEWRHSPYCWNEIRKCWWVVSFTPRATLPSVPTDCEAGWSYSRYGPFWKKKKNCTRRKQNHLYHSPCPARSLVKVETSENCFCINYWPADSNEPWRFICPNKFRYWTRLSALIISDDIIKVFLY